MLVVERESVCVCVLESEGFSLSFSLFYTHTFLLSTIHERESVCVCVCVEESVCSSEEEAV